MNRRVQPCFLTEPRRVRTEPPDAAQKEHATARLMLRGPLLPMALGRVHGALSAIHGVSAVLVSLESQDATVHFDLCQVGMLQFKRALQAVGIAVGAIVVDFHEEVARHAGDGG